MPMDFHIPARVEDLRSRIAAFVERELLPLESSLSSFDEHENIRLDLLCTLREKAKSERLWCLQLKPETGGLGLNKAGMAVCYEAMNRSIFGPVVFHGAAPDDGNMRVLEMVAREDQKARWLQPIIDGEVQSAFAMTEPDGCGSDPSMTYTRAERQGNDRWVVRGRKHYITGAAEAKHFILMARTSDDDRTGLTAFLFHADSPGWRIARRIPIMGPEEHGGHCEVEFDGLEIPDEDVLMGVGDGLRVTQIRLGPARLTHCMRWTGLGRRALEIALDRIETRMAFGQKLADKESVQQMIGQAAMELDIGRLLTMRAAWLLDQGSLARKEISMAKVVVADALHKAVDTSLQLLGARGYSKDEPVEWMYRYVRQARLVDGASEVHRMVLANFLRRQGKEFFAWGAVGRG